MKNFSCLLFLLLSTLTLSTSAQPNVGGAVLVSPTEYASFPRPNWDTLAKYSPLPQQQFSSNSTFGEGSFYLITPPIMSQGSQSSCVGWAVGYAAMSSILYPKYYCWADALRSPSHLYNQIKVSSTCLAGSYIKDGLNLAKNQGVCSYNLFPYNDNNCSTLPNNVQIADANANKALDWYALDQNDVQGIIKAINLGYPVVIGFELYASFNTMWANGGIWNQGNSGLKNDLDHAATIVGYDNTLRRFKAQNSWGTTGGDNGYFWITYENVANSILKELYVLYGSKVENIQSINGSSTLCTGQNSYTVENLRPGSTVSWSISSGNASSLTVNGNTAILSSNSNGVVTLQASVTTACNDTFNLYKNIAVGVVKPQYTICGYDPNDGCRYPKISFAVTNIGDYPTGSIYNWYLNGTLMASTSNPFWTHNLNLGNCDSYLELTVTISNSCGTSFPAGETVYYACESSGFLRYSISPNPTTGTVQIVAKDKKRAIKEVIIADRTGKIRKQSKFSAEEFKSQISLDELPSDTYIIKIYDGKSWTSSQIIKK